MKSGLFWLAMAVVLFPFALLEFLFSKDPRPHLGFYWFEYELLEDGEDD